MQIYKQISSVLSRKVNKRVECFVNLIRKSYYLEINLMFFYKHVKSHTLFTASYYILDLKKLCCYCLFYMKY